MASKNQWHKQTTTDDEKGKKKHKPGTEKGSQFDSAVRANELLDGCKNSILFVHNKGKEEIQKALERYNRLFMWFESGTSPEDLVLHPDSFLIWKDRFVVGLGDLVIVTFKRETDDGSQVLDWEVYPKCENALYERKDSWRIPDPTFLDAQCDVDDNHYVDQLIVGNGLELLRASSCVIVGRKNSVHNAKNCLFIGEDLRVKGPQNCLVGMLNTLLLSEGGRCIGVGNVITDKFKKNVDIHKQDKIEWEQWGHNGVIPPQEFSSNKYYRSLPDIERLEKGTPVNEVMKKIGCPVTFRDVIGDAPPQQKLAFALSVDGVTDPQQLIKDSNFEKNLLTAEQELANVEIKE